jgi:hypothetical protein
MLTRALLCLAASCGDVAWEAQVSSSRLAASGLEWDETEQCVIRRNSDTGAGQQHDAAAAAAADDGPAGAEDGDGVGRTAATSGPVGVPEKMVRPEARGRGGDRSVCGLPC